MSKKKKIQNKPLYDSNGRWVQERGMVKGALRRTFRLSPQMKEVVEAARVELSPALKKDGTPGKRPRVRFRCACCSKLFSKKDIQVDHIITVVPLHIAEADMNYDEIVRGVFCGKENLQVLCSTPMKRSNGKTNCHQKKTNKEKYFRKRIAEIVIIYGSKIEDKAELERTMVLVESEYGRYLEEKKRKAAEKAERKRLREIKLQEKLDKIK